jgi:putative transcriptional regulator
LNGFTVSQVRDWEQGRNRPRDAARTYLMLIQSAPQDVRALLDTARSKSAA